MKCVIICFLQLNRNNILNTYLIYIKRILRAFSCIFQEYKGREQWEKQPHLFALAESVYQTIKVSYDVQYCLVNQL